VGIGTRRQGSQILCSHKKSRYVIAFNGHRGRTNTLELYVRHGSHGVGGGKKSTFFHTRGWFNPRGLRHPTGDAAGVEETASAAGTEAITNNCTGMGVFFMKFPLPVCKVHNGLRHRDSPPDEVSAGSPPGPVHLRPVRTGQILSGLGETLPTLPGRLFRRGHRAGHSPEARTRAGNAQIPVRRSSRTLLAD
jgi:hypothetical protein